MSDFFEAPSLEYLGQHLPQYAFEDFIAQGGMGAVYRARQISLDRVVAIKVLPHELGENQEFRESFSKEAKAMAKVNHPNLIGVFDSGDVDGMPYIVMEYIEGQSLHDFCWGEVIDADTAVAITKGICDGLANAHEHGIIHRDIKPANILLTERLEPKIGDFGLAHPSDSEESGLVMGTPGYTAPEIFINPDLAGVLADQYSVGMILHQLITGIDPAGTSGPPTQASGRIRLDAIWRKATQLDPAQRYPSVAAMSEALHQWANSKKAAPAPGKALNVGAPNIRPTTLVVQKSNSGGLVKLAVLTVLCVGAWFGYTKLKGDNDPTQENITETPLPGQPGQPGQPDITDLLPPPPSPHTPGTHKPEPSRPTNPDPGNVATNHRPDPRPKPEISRPEIPTAPQPLVGKPQLPPGDLELRDKAIALILKEREKRNNLLSKNTKEFQRLLDREAATATSSDAKTYEQLRKQCDSGWLPEPDALPDVNGTISRAYHTAHQEQVSIVSKYNEALARIRDYYVPYLEKAAAKTSDPELKQRLLAQADRARNLEKWVSLLAPEDQGAAITMQPSLENRSHAPRHQQGGFIGRWNVVSDKSTQWQTDADGNITVIGPGWKGTWQILGDGTLQINFSGKDPYSLTRNGAGWSGRTGFNRPISITPAN